MIIENSVVLTKEFLTVALINAKPDGFLEIDGIIVVGTLLGILVSGNVVGGFEVVGTIVDMVGESVGVFVDVTIGEFEVVGDKVGTRVGDVVNLNDGITDGA